MEIVRSQLTVFFEEPFWVGVYERRTGGHTEASRIVFGAEPKDADVYRLVLERLYGLRFSPAVEEEAASAPLSANPKRLQRLAARALEHTGIGTKAQQALQLLREESKQERKVKSRREQEAEDARQFLLRQEKRKQKHKGH